MKLLHFVAYIYYFFYRQLLVLHLNCGNQWVEYWWPTILATEIPRMQFHALHCQRMILMSCQLLEGKSLYLTWLLSRFSLLRKFTIDAILLRFLFFICTHYIWIEVISQASGWVNTTNISPFADNSFFSFSISLTWSIIAKCYYIDTGFQTALALSLCISDHLFGHFVLGF